MTAAALLSLAMRLHHAYAHGAPSRARPHVEAIAATDATADEARELLVVDFRETTFRSRDRRGRTITPFGAQALARRGGRHGLDDYARAALATLRMAARVCGRSRAARMGFYVHGRCVVDREARARAAMVRRLAAGVAVR